MAGRKRPSAAASEAGKRLRQGDSVAGLAENERRQIATLKRALRKKTTRKKSTRKKATRKKTSRKSGRR